MEAIYIAKELIATGYVRNGFTSIEEGIGALEMVYKVTPKAATLIWGIDDSAKYTFLPEISFDI